MYKIHLRGENVTSLAANSSSKSEGLKGCAVFNPVARKSIPCPRLQTQYTNNASDEDGHARLDLSWITWKSLNRLRVEQGRSKALMEVWSLTIHTFPTSHLALRGISGRFPGNQNFRIKPHQPAGAPYLYGCATAESVT